jgi:hypothetical protein
MRPSMSAEALLDSRPGIVLRETGKFTELYYPLTDFREDLQEEPGAEFGSADAAVERTRRRLASREVHQRLA